MESLGNKITIRLGDDDMQRASDASQAAGIPVATFARIAFLEALEKENLRAVFRRQEKFLAEILRRQVVDFQISHQAKPLEEARQIAVDITTNFCQRLDDEE